MHNFGNLLTDFRNSYTVVLCNKFETRRLLYFPLHLKRVTTLPCETSAVDMFDFQQVTNDVKADLLMCYNILTNRVCLASSDFFTIFVTTYTRGNSMKLSQTQCITARDGHAFHKRVINIWNALPECVVSANSISSFKRKLRSLSFSMP